jgi:hypothetical protein
VLQLGEQRSVDAIGASVLSFKGTLLVLLCVARLVVEFDGAGFEDLVGLRAGDLRQRECGRFDGLVSGFALGLAVTVGHG